MTRTATIQCLGLLAAAALAGLGIITLSPQVQPSVQAAQPPTPYPSARVRTGSLPVNLTAAGAVRSAQTATLAWQTIGIVDQVHASLGQTVTAGTVLAELAQTSLPQNVILAQPALVSAQKALDLLLNTDQERTNAALTLAKAQKALDDARKAARSDQFQRASQQTIDIAQANLIVANKALDDAETIYNQNKNRSSTDVTYAAALAQLAAAQQKQQQAQYNLNYVSGLPNPLDVAINQANLDVAQANLLAAQVTWERVKDGPNPEDVAAAKAQVAAAQATLNMALITAPFPGTITQVSAHPGDQAAPAGLAFQIDDLSHLFVDLTIPQASINQVKVGQPASLTFDAIPGKTYAGAVSQVSPVGKAAAGTANFTVTIEITQNAPEIKPGMTLTAGLAAEQGAQTLLVPTSAVRYRGGQSILYRIDGASPVPVAVMLGQAASGETQVLAGQIHDGDLVVSDPVGLP